jgi:protein TorT
MQHTAMHLALFLRRSFATGLVGAAFCTTPALAEDWYPIAAIVDGKHTNYVPAGPASKPWRICALLPHLRDKYWWGVSWGLADEAGRQGVKLGTYEAGGYEHLDTQRKQFADCLAMKADAIILAASSQTGLNEQIEQAVKQGVPVLDLVNGVSSRAIAARSLVSFADMSAAAARYVLADARDRRIKVAWFPGPKDAGWVIDAQQGIERTFDATRVELQHAGFGPPELSRQMSLMRTVLETGSPDYIVGNAVAVEAAAAYLRAKPGNTARLVSFYATEPVIALIRRGRVMAAPSDSSVAQARIAIDLAVRMLDKKPFARRVSPVIEIVDASNIERFDLSKLFPNRSPRFFQQALPQ